MHINYNKNTFKTKRAHEIDSKMGHNHITATPISIRKIIIYLFSFSQEKKQKKKESIEFAYIGHKSRGILILW